MIKNIIFDVGNVLLNFIPNTYLEERYNKELSEKLFQEIFKCDEWLLMDHGKLTKTDFIKIISERNSDLSMYMESIMNDVVDYMLIPIEENFKLLKDLKNSGYKIYILSNFIKEYFEIVENKYDVFKIADGIVVSSRIEMMKPNNDIYYYIMKKYSLKPEECLFIDDTFSNIETANNIGFNTVHYKGLEDNFNIMEILGK